MNATNDNPAAPVVPRRPWGWVAGMCLAGVCALVMRLWPGPEILDDAYITYRIAENIASGKGFVYNAGEKLQSSTTPAYTLLLSLLPRAGVDVPRGSFVINALAGMAAAMLLFLAVRRICGDGRAALAGALLFAVYPGSVVYSIAGMETPVFELFLIAAGTAFLFRRDWLAAILAGILPLLRPEGLVVSAILGVALIVAKRNRVWAYGIVALLPLAAWIAWATAYFGTPIPHSVSEKQKFFTDPRFAVGLAGFLRQWAYHFYSLFWGNPVNGERINNTRYAVILLGGAPFALGYAYQIFKSAVVRPRALPLALAPGLFALACILGQAGLPFPWYFMPTAGLFIALSFCGLFALLRDGLARRPWGAVAAGGAVLAAGILLAGHHLAANYKWSPRVMPATLYDHVFPHREPAYEEVGQWLGAQGGDDRDIVLCAEVGAVGYFCRYKVWDQHLTQPPWAPERGGALVDKYRPRFITFMAIYPPVEEVKDQPETVRVGRSQVPYRKVFCVNKENDPRYTLPRERHNVLVYERED